MAKYELVSLGAQNSNSRDHHLVDKLCKALDITPSAAQKYLQEGNVLKENLSLSLARGLSEVFTEYGLRVAIREVATPQTRPIDHQEQATNNAHKPSPKLKADFVKLLNGDFPRSSVSREYRFGLICTVLVTMITPLIYLAMLLGLITFSIFYFSVLVNNIGDMSGGLFSKLLLIVPYFIVSVLFLFLLKPLFARYQEPKRYRLQAKRAPALFNLVYVMCDKLSVPRPAEICLDTEVNASAGGLDGLLSLRRGQLRLTIGLPLLTGMNMRQLSGILAHEFGHFAQSQAMQTRYIVHTVNTWFQSRAYEPDEWDIRLEKWAEQEHMPLMMNIAIFAAQTSIGLTRFIFSALFKLNFRLTQYMSRAMEFDADSYESRFVGSEQFEKTAIELRKLALASQKIADINKLAWNDNKLLINIPLAIANLAKQTSAEQLSKIEQQINRGESTPWDSHPTDLDRIKFVTRRNDKGIFSCELPADQLITEIDTLCESVSAFFYTIQGIKKPSNHMVNNDQLIENEQHKQQTAEHLKAFFGDIYSGRFFHLSTLVDNKPNDLADCIKQIDSQHALIKAQEDKYFKQLDTLRLSSLVKVYYEANLNVDPKDFDLAANSRIDITNLISQSTASIKQMQNELKHFDKLLHHRVFLSRSFMPHQQATRLDSLLSALQGMVKLEPIINNLERYHFILETLLNVEEEWQSKIQSRLFEQTKRCALEVNHLSKEAKNILLANPKYPNLAEFIESWSGGTLDYSPSTPVSQYLFIAEQSINATKYQYYWLCAELSKLCIEAQPQNHRPLVATSSSDSLVMS
ncbi:M48 family metalloprotease [Agarivorans sp. TSD2052]|uniref:M48 family metallopeptidase n=1 Tax=Agarivorans sp. TSD2052 TaxID=2937286 RepID=UPI00200DDA27|nr:M48 family metallopeptidase [Agarivorans sp. TSD2052]UPW17278.1 M48 family metalloprotease [Agarivorans sp. TSD2052]